MNEGEEDCRFRDFTALKRDKFNDDNFATVTSIEQVRIILVNPNINPDIYFFSSADN